MLVCSQGLSRKVGLVLVVDAWWRGVVQLRGLVVLLCCKVKVVRVLIITEKRVIGFLLLLLLLLLLQSRVLVTLLATSSPTPTCKETLFLCDLPIVIGI